MSVGSPVVRVTAQPRLLSDGSLQTVRMAGGGSRLNYYLGGNHYRAGVFDLPRFSAAFGWDDGGWNGSARPQIANIGWSPSIDSDLATYSGTYLWKDAPITAEIGTEGNSASPDGIEINGDTGFDTPAYWTGTSGGWALTGGNAVGTAANGWVWKGTVSIVANTLYQMTYTVSGRTAGSVRPYVGSGPNAYGTARSADGTYTDVILATSGAEFGLNSNDGFTGNVTFLSVQNMTQREGGGDPTDWTSVLTGAIQQIAAQQGQLIFTIADHAAKLDKPIISAHFAGTGGVEGPAEAEGRDKRRSYGYVFNVEGRILDKVNNIWEFGDPAFQLQAITDVRDVGRSAAPTPTSVAWQGSVAATLTALQAAAAADGSGVVAPSIGCVKWWTQPNGPLTADLIGSGDYGNTAVALAKHIIVAQGLTLSTIPSTVTSLMANTANAGVHIGDDGVTSANALDRLLLGAGLFWRLSPVGTVDVMPIAIANPGEVIVADTVKRQQVFMPHRSRRMGYKRNERQMSDGEIASVILSGDIGDFGDYIVPPYLNKLRNDLFDAYYWTLTGTSGGAPSQKSGLKGANYTQDAWRSKVLEVPLGGSQLKQAQSAKIPVVAGRWYWSVVMVAASTGATAGGGSVKIDGNFRNAAGTSLGSQTTSIAIGSLVAGYNQLIVATQAPANAVTLDFIAAVTSNTGTGSVRFDGPAITDVEPQADVTMSVGFGPATDTIQYDSTGAALSGELPATYVYKLQTASGAYAGTVTWKYKVILGTVNGNASGTTEYTTNISGTSGTGTLTINSLGANSCQVEVITYVNGRRRSTVLTLTKDILPAATTGGGTSGGSSSQSSGFTSFSGTTFVAVTADLLYTTPTGQTTITVSSTLQATPSGFTPTGTWNIEFKIQRETSPGTWTDVGLLVSDTSVVGTDAEGGPTRNPADVTVSRQSTGLTAGVQYKFRGVARINATGSTNTSRSHNVTGTFSGLSP